MGGRIWRGSSTCSLPNKASTQNVQRKFMYSLDFNKDQKEIFHRPQRLTVKFTHEKNPFNQTQSLSRSASI